MSLVSPDDAFSFVSIEDAVSAVLQEKMALLAEHLGNAAPAMSAVGANFKKLIHEALVEMPK
ncbi:hypothetical protein JYP52_21310 [Nitratireductor aquibiodomus]|uniref:hypothetical protein n=1 Tax=Nitratireductor aquibiodomus TaxID=204799 RepID=UPI0019D39362|nr:hypothetical protein [Nitratireductor aquibiodomus]MBN7763680.1 hypothetical protein [Nitratireductor aquibiodomus]